MEAIGGPAPVVPGICTLRRSGLVGHRISGPFRRCAVSIRLLEQLKSQWLCWGPDSDGCRLHLGQIDGQVVGEPAVAGLERLGFGGLRVTHDAGSVAEWLEGRDPVVPDPERLPPSGEVDLLGREARHPGVGLDRLSPSLSDLHRLLVSLRLRDPDAAAAVPHQLHVPPAQGGDLGNPQQRVPHDGGQGPSTRPRRWAPSAVSV